MGEVNADGAGPAAHVVLEADIADLVDLLVGLLRWAGQVAGLPEHEIEQSVAAKLSFLRHRLTGEFSVDEFGFDEEFAEHVHLTLLRPLFRHWFRVEVVGAEHLPPEGAALLVMNHSGTIAFDVLMAQVAVHDHSPTGRWLRLLGADLLFGSPVLGDLARKAGATLATHADAAGLLERGHLVGVCPEGFKGVGKPFRDRYRLQRFGRGGFVAAALRAGAPIIPTAIIGAEETYPMLANLPQVAKLLKLPYFPVTPLFPHLGVLGVVPLPSKWIIQFGPPIDTAGLGPADADDAMLVFELTDRVRESIQRTVYELLEQRGPAFF
ncbi:MAG: acyltransferase family protein [Austwickia sp.]|nr:acyltransferase family protein [Austwickia sp.]MBK8436644.1 acyltransferase family protein [Austwickia sp.]MBK9100276.1 acyltransferase family protein [Austwickia sp.]